MVYVDPRLRTAEIELDNELLRYELSPNMKLVSEMPAQTVLATSTFYRTGKDGQWNSVVKMRADVALKTLRTASEMGYKVICVDENSDAGWRQEAGGIDGVSLINPDFERYSSGNHNMGRCRRQAIAEATFMTKDDHRCVVSWIEPEKCPFLLNPNGAMPLAMAATPLYEGIADFVIPRVKDNLKSYPPVQQMMEFSGNLAARNVFFAYAERIGKSPEEAEEFTQYLDHFRGPKMFRADEHNLEFYLEYGEMAQTNPTLNDQWGSVHFPTFMAIMDGNRVRGVPVPYVHPIEQTKAEALNIGLDLKRYEQGDKLTRGLIDFLNLDLAARGKDPLKV